MLIRNIGKFDRLDLYKCKKVEHLELLEHGFTPISFDDDWYYYLNDKKLQEYLNNK